MCCLRIINLLLLWTHFPSFWALWFLRELSSSIFFLKAFLNWHIWKELTYQLNFVPNPSSISISGPVGMKWGLPGEPVSALRHDAWLPSNHASTGSLDHWYLTEKSEEISPWWNGKKKGQKIVEMRWNLMSLCDQDQHGHQIPCCYSK